MELNYVQTGLACVRLGDILFTSPKGGKDILESARLFMEQNDSWVSIMLFRHGLLTRTKKGTRLNISCILRYCQQGLTSGLSRVLQKVQERAQSETQDIREQQEGTV